MQDPGTPAYTTLVSLVDGTARNYTRRERPKLLLNATGSPSTLYTAMCEDSSQGANCYTIGVSVVE